MSYGASEPAAEDIDDNSGPDNGTDSSTPMLPSTRPALRAVQYDQAAIVNRPLKGFRSPVGIIRWLQRAAVVSLGELPDELFEDLVLRDETMRQALLTSESRSAWFHEPIPDELADELRRDLVAVHLAPACVSAYSSLEATATEYTERDVYDSDSYSPTDLDPENQRFTAMRPGYDEIDRDQRACLRAYWGGFDSRDDLLDWLTSLESPTNSQIPSDFTSEVLHDEVAVEYLCNRVENQQKAKTYQEWFIGAHVLPAFAAGVRDLSPTEVIHAESEGIPIYGN